MATAAPKPVVQTRSACDRVFYSGMAILMSLAVFTGFARTYYLSTYFGTLRIFCD
jgi:hypothetical protein